MSIGDEVIRFGQTLSSSAIRLDRISDLDEQIEASSALSDMDIETSKLITEASALGSRLDSETLEKLSNRFDSIAGDFQNRSFRDKRLKESFVSKVKLRKERTFSALQTLGSKAAVDRYGASVDDQLSAASTSVLSNPKLLGETFKNIDSIGNETNTFAVINGVNTELINPDVLQNKILKTKFETAYSAITSLVDSGRSREALDLFNQYSEEILEAGGGVSHASLRSSIRQSIKLQDSEERGISNEVKAVMHAGLDYAAGLGTEELFKYRNREDVSAAFDADEIRSEAYEDALKTALKSDNIYESYLDTAQMGGTVTLTKDEKRVLNQRMQDLSRNTYQAILAGAERNGINPIQAIQLATDGAIRAIEKMPRGWVPPDSSNFLLELITSEDVLIAFNSPDARRQLARRVISAVGKDSELAEARRKDSYQSRKLRKIQYLTEGKDLDQVNNILAAEDQQNPVEVQRNLTAIDNYDRERFDQLLENYATAAIGHNIMGVDVHWMPEWEFLEPFAIGRDFEVDDRVYSEIMEEAKSYVRLGMQPDSAVENAQASVILHGARNVDVYTEVPNFKIGYNTPMRILGIAENTLHGLGIQTLYESGLIDLQRGRWIGNETRGLLDWANVDDLVNRITYEHVPGPNGEDTWVMRYDNELILGPDGRAAHIFASDHEKYRGARSFGEAIRMDPDRKWGDINWQENNFERRWQTLNNHGSQIEIRDPDVALLEEEPLPGDLPPIEGEGPNITLGDLNRWLNDPRTDQYYRRREVFEEFGRMGNEFLSGD